MELRKVALAPFYHRFAWVPLGTMAQESFVGILRDILYKPDIYDERREQQVP